MRLSNMSYIDDSIKVEADKISPTDLKLLAEHLFYDTALKTDRGKTVGCLIRTDDGRHKHPSNIIYCDYHPVKYDDQFMKLLDSVKPTIEYYSNGIKLRDGNGVLASKYLDINLKLEGKSGFRKLLLVLAYIDYLKLPK